MFGCGVNNISFNGPADVDPASNQKIGLSGAEGSISGQTPQLINRSAVF